MPHGVMGGGDDLMAMAREREQGILIKPDTSTVGYSAKLVALTCDGDGLEGSTQRPILGLGAVVPTA